MSVTQHPGHRHFDVLMTVFVAVLLTSNVASVKFVVLGPLTFDGGTLLFPVAYILGDVLTEVYGYRQAQRAIWTGFFCAALMVAVFALVGALPPAPDWDAQDAYARILGATPRIVLGSLVAYLAGSFSNAYILARIKVLMQGRHLWVRTIASTLVGELIDTLLFVVIAFYGQIQLGLLISVIVSNYIFKVSLEVLATPGTYAVSNWLKRVEGEDHFDHDLRLLPFRRRK